MRNILNHFLKEDTFEYEIHSNHFTRYFKDPLLEEKYFIEMQGKTEYIFIIYLLIIILSNIYMIIYGFYLISRISEIFFFAINSFTLIGYIIMFILYIWFIKSNLKKRYIELFSTILFSTIFSTFLFSFMWEKLIFNFTRIIYLLSISKIFFFLIITDYNLLFWLISLIFDITVIIIFSIFSKNFNFEDTAIITIIYFLFYILKKDLDKEKRNSFIENEKLKKYKKYFEYSSKLIDSSAGLHISFSSKKLIYANNNSNSLLTFIIKNLDNKGDIIFLY
jgi:hypothetical protein